jgi:hypothetical protein
MPKGGTRQPVECGQTRIVGDDTLGHVIYRYHVYRFCLTKTWNNFILIWCFNIYFYRHFKICGHIFSLGTPENSWTQPKQVVT